MGAGLTRLLGYVLVSYGLVPAIHWVYLYGGWTIKTRLLGYVLVSYGLVSAIHWVYLCGGWSNQIVRISFSELWTAPSYVPGIHVSVWGLGQIVRVLQVFVSYGMVPVIHWVYMYLYGGWSNQIVRVRLIVFKTVCTTVAY